MEKQRINAKSRFIKRLLIFVFLIFNVNSSIFSQYLTYSIIKDLRITPVENQDLYANTEIKFEVTVPYTMPSQMQISIPDLPQNVTFQTLRRTESYSEPGSTRIELWLSFSKEGTYKLPALNVKINDVKRTIKFSEVTISVNPMELSPRLVYVFEDGTTIYSDQIPPEKEMFSVELGQKINFTVNVQYAVQVLQMNWHIPENSIFSQTRAYEITEVKYREKSFSEKLIPVADFEWIILEEGTYKLPQMVIVATGYNGYKAEIGINDYFVKAKNAQLVQTEEKNKMFEEAFIFEKTEILQENKTISQEDCQKLADLRKAERNAIFSYFTNKKNRIEFEKQLGLPSDVKEFPCVVLYFSCFLVLLFVILLVFFIAKKSYFKGIFVAVILMCSVVLMIFSIAKINDIHAIATGGVLQSIPEESAEAKIQIVQGTFVQIVETTKEWYYIEFGSSGGWIKKENIILIK